MNRALNFVGLVLLVVCIFVFGLRGMSVEMGIAVAASTVFLAFVNLEKFSEFKGAGFEAKLKDVIGEANATIEQLRSVANPLIETSLVALMKAGRFSPGAFSKDHSLFDRLKLMVEQMNLDDPSVKESMRGYVCIHAWDLVLEFIGEVERSNKSKLSEKFSNLAGKRNYTAPPSLSLLDDLLRDQEISEELNAKYHLVVEYYRKYML